MIKTSIADVEWKTFNVSDIFHIINSKPYHTKNLNFSKENGIPYITRSAANNGVYGWVKFEKNLQLNPANVISFGAETAQFFYQPKSYITGNKMYYLKCDALNENNALFIIQSLKKSIQESGFSYGKGLTGTRISRRKIQLPVDSQTGNPDWNIMDNYIKEKKKYIISKVINYYSKFNTSNKVSHVPVKNKKYKAFFMSDILDIKSGVRLTKAAQVAGKIPFIGASDKNNGITNFVRNTNKSLDKNVLGVNYNGSVVENFYHPYEAIFSDDVKRVQFKNRHFRNKYCYLFLKQMILLQKDKYRYGYKFNGERMKRQKILLPVDENNNVDYIYMENCIKVKEEKIVNNIIKYLKTK